MALSFGLLIPNAMGNVAIVPIADIEKIAGHAAWQACVHPRASTTFSRKISLLQGCFHMKTVLIVDDEPNYLIVLSELLGEEGFDERHEGGLLGHGA